MEVSAEAKRIMVVALGKLYSSRTQRGGLRLHRSLLLTVVMKSARDIYHAAQAEQRPAETAPCPATQHVGESVDHRDSQPLLCDDTDGLGGRDDKENRGPAVSPLHRHSRKRRGKAAAEPDFLPCKKAKMEGKGLQQLVLNSVLRNSVNCGGMVGARPNPVPVSCAIVAF